MNKTIYLDWNVFQDIFQKRRNLELKENLEYFRDKKNYKIIFSSSHMRDLCKCKNKEYIQNDLSSLSDLTKNWCVGLSGNEIITMIQKNPKEVFDYMNEKLDNEIEDLENIGVKFYFEPFAVDVSKLSEGNILRPFLDSNHILSPDAMGQFIESFKYNIFSDHEQQKKFRNSLKEVREINNPAYINFSELKIYKYLLSSKQKIIENFTDIVNSFLSISGKSLDKISIGERITTSYRILDFFPAFSERLDKRNSQSNISIDSEHLFFASDSRYLICGDEKMVEKAKIVYELCGIETKILNPSEFMNVTII